MKYVRNKTIKPFLYNNLRTLRKKNHKKHIFYELFNHQYAELFRYFDLN